MTYISTEDLFTALQRVLDGDEQLYMDAKALRSALKEAREKIAEVEQERDALLSALRGIQTMDIPFFCNGESDYQRAFSTCVREAGKALEEFYKTRPPNSGETERLEPASISPASEGAGPPKCPTCEGSGKTSIYQGAMRIADEVLAGNVGEGALRYIGDLSSVESSGHIGEETQKFSREFERIVLTAREALREIEARKVKP